MTNTDIGLGHDDLPLVVCDEWNTDGPEVTTRPERAVPAWLDPDGIQLYRSRAHFELRHEGDGDFADCQRVLVLID